MCGICVEDQTVSFFARLVIGDDSARLHGHGNQPLVYHAALDYAVGFLEGFGNVAAFEMPMESNVVAILLRGGAWNPW